MNQKGFIFTMDALLAIIPVFIILSAIPHLVGEVSEIAQLQASSLHSSKIAEDSLEVFFKKINPLVQSAAERIIEAWSEGNVTLARSIANRTLRLALSDEYNYALYIAVWNETLAFEYIVGRADGSTDQASVEASQNLAKDLQSSMRLQSRLNMTIPYYAAVKIPTADSIVSRGSTFNAEVWIANRIPYKNISSFTYVISDENGNPVNSSTVTFSPPIQFGNMSTTQIAWDVGCGYSGKHTLTVKNLRYSDGNLVEYNHTLGRPSTRDFVVVPFQPDVLKIKVSSNQNEYTQGQTASFTVYFENFMKTITVTAFDWRLEYFSNNTFSGSVDSGNVDINLPPCNSGTYTLNINLDPTIANVKARLTVTPLKGNIFKTPINSDYYAGSPATEVWISSGEVGTTYQFNLREGDYDVGFLDYSNHEHFDANETVMVDTNVPLARYYLTIAAKNHQSNVNNKFMFLTGPGIGEGATVKHYLGNITVTNTSWKNYTILLNEDLKNDVLQIRLISGDDCDIAWFILTEYVPVYDRYLVETELQELGGDEETYFLDKGDGFEIFTRITKVGTNPIYKENLTLYYNDSTYRLIPIWLNMAGETGIQSWTSSFGTSYIIGYNMTPHWWIEPERLYQDASTLLPLNRTIFIPPTWYFYVNTITEVDISTDQMVYTTTDAINTHITVFNKLETNVSDINLTIVPADWINYTYRFDLSDTSKYQGETSPGQEITYYDKIYILAGGDRPGKWEIDVTQIIQDPNTPVPDVKIVGKPRALNFLVVPGYGNVYVLKLVVWR